MHIEDLKKAIFEIDNEESFEKLALEIFRFQYDHLPTYKTFCEHLKKNPSNVSNLTSIPFLPIEFFKKKDIYIGANKGLYFLSSGTGNQERSRHYIADHELYIKSFESAFRSFVGPPEEFVILSLLPSYRNNQQSSLIYMIDHLQKQAKDGSNEVNGAEEVLAVLKSLNKSGQRVILFGVAFALLDLIPNIDFDCASTIVIETGGMKGQKQEITRSELHERIDKGLKPHSIISEYGMTELLSQAYALSPNGFKSPPWMKLMIRDLHDPLEYIDKGTGGINVIDLANIYSCSFIATSDLGRIDDQGFQVMGRFDYSDLRGCNLLVQST